jgi:hypothetical protein
MSGNVRQGQDSNLRKESKKEMRKSQGRVTVKVRHSNAAGCLKQTGLKARSAREPWGLEEGQLGVSPSTHTLEKKDAIVGPLPWSSAVLGMGDAVNAMQRHLT